MKKVVHIVNIHRVNGFIFVYRVNYYLYINSILFVFFFCDSYNTSYVVHKRLFSFYYLSLSLSRYILFSNIHLLFISYSSLILLDNFQCITNDFCTISFKMMISLKNICDIELCVIHILKRKIIDCVLSCVVFMCSCNIFVICKYI